MTSNQSWLSMAIALLLLTFGCQKKDGNLIRFVNPLIGTGKSVTLSGTPGEWGPQAWGQVIPAVSTPFGMTQWTPQTNDTENKCMAPYYYDGKKIQGFRGSHWLGGSCTQDYGSFTIMPITGYLRTFASERASSFIHENETSTPAYYSCLLEDYTTYVEMTGTARSGFFRFSYVSKARATILITPNSDQGQGYVKIDPEKQEIYGYNPVYRTDGEPAQPAGFCGYFVVKFNMPFSNYGCFFQMEDHKGETEISGRPDIGAYASFDIPDNTVIMAKAGTSFTSMEAARANLEAEIPHWDFLKTKADTEHAWNQLLASIQLKGGKTEDYTGFYTSLYRSLLYPRTFSDADGSYPGFDGNKTIMKVEKGHVYYDDFLLGSTHRAQLPLVSLLAPDRYEDMMKSLVLKAEQGGWLPVLPLRNSYNNDMSGDHVTTALGDAYMKGFDISIDKAYPNLRKNAFEIASDEDYGNNKGRRGMKSFLENGLVALEDSLNAASSDNKQVSLAGEYAVSDFVLSKVAEKYEKAEDAQLLAQRAAQYLDQGLPMELLLPVSQGIPLIVDLNGDKKQVHEKLDRFFTGRRYRHWDPLYHSIPYLYNYTGDPAETQRKVKHILATQYNNFDSGIPGNDESGQKSAWYVFSAMGFYPVAPGSGEYQLSSPVFSEVVLNLDPTYYPGKHLKITAEGNAGNSVFNIVSFNDKEIGFVLKQEDLKKGGRLEFLPSK
ncbi:MAG TPA: GH92 family glycosyl hydrolase [Prolixibacteraceae bacterium]|nr:GH92 family glycosyl hydrolase [Prolixibacteraceae bacterium]